MKLQDYIHYYIGCKMIRSSHWEPQNEPYILDNKNMAEAIEYSDRPILRRLEDMTEDEMIGMLQSMAPPDMEDKPTLEDYDLEMFYNDDGLMVDSDIAVGANYSCVCYEGQIAIKICGSIILFYETGKDVTRDELINVPKAFHYLLQQGFDLFGLIDADLAIDAKTVNP